MLAAAMHRRNKAGEEEWERMQRHFEALKKELPAAHALWIALKERTLGTWMQ